MCHPSQTIGAESLKRKYSTKRSHFIFEKGSGKLVDVQMGVTAAEESVACCFDMIYERNLM